jgi:hypothetical protein
MAPLSDDKFARSQLKVRDRLMRLTLWRRATNIWDVPAPTVSPRSIAPSNPSFRNLETLMRGACGSHSEAPNLFPWE